MKILSVFSIFLFLISCGSTPDTGISSNPNFIKGKLFYSDNKPIKNALVVAINELDSFKSTTKADGAFSIAVEDDKQYLVQASLSGHLIFKIADVSPNGEDATLLEFKTDFDSTYYPDSVFNKKNDKEETDTTKIDSTKAEDLDKDTTALIDSTKVEDLDNDTTTLISPDKDSTSDDGFVLEIDKVEVSVDAKTVEVPVFIKENIGFNGVNVEFNYDSGITLTEIKSSDDFLYDEDGAQIGLYEVNPSANAVIWLESSGKETIINGQWVTLVFEVLDAKIGDRFEIKTIKAEASAEDAESTLIYPTVINGEILIVDIISNE